MYILPFVGCVSVFVFDVFGVVISEDSVIAMVLHVTESSLVLLNEPAEMMLMESNNCGVELTYYALGVTSF